MIYTSMHTWSMSFGRVSIRWLVLFVMGWIGQIDAQTDSVMISNIITEIQRSIHSGDFVQSDELSDSILENYADVLGREMDLAANVYHLSFSSKIILGKSKEAREIYEAGFRHLNQFVPPHYGGMAKLLMAYAGTFNANLQMDSILVYLNPAEEYLSKDSRDKGSLVSLYYQKAKLAYNYSDYDGQISYALKGLELQEKYFSHHHLMRISFCNSIGIGYRNLHQLDDAQKYFLRGLQTEARYPNEKSMHARISNNLGVVNMGKANYKQAIEYISQAINYYRDYVSETDSEIGSGYDNLSRCYQKLDDMENGERFARKSLAFMLKNLRPNHRDLVLPYLTLGQFWMKSNQLDSAEYYFLMAQDVLLENGWTREDPGGNFILEDAFEVFSHLILLRKKQYEDLHEPKALNLATGAMEDFMSTSEYAFQKYNTTTSVENYFRAYSTTFDHALACLYYKFEKHATKEIPLDGVRWIEQFKAMELRYAFQRDKVKMSGAYKVLNLEHKVLQRELMQLEDELHDTMEPSDSLINKLHHAKIHVRDWKQNLLKEWPAYYNLIYHSEVDIESYQDQLANDESIILYKLGKVNLFAVVINQAELNIYQLPFGKMQVEACKSWLRGINEFGTAAKYDDQRLEELLAENIEFGRELFKALIEPLSAKLREHVLIIPDDVLGLIPFSALLTNEITADRDIKQYPFLIHQHKISYCHSLSLYKEMQDKKIAPTRRLLAMAPSYKKGNNLDLDSLQHNKLEAQLVGGIFNGRVEKGTAANRKFFDQSCSAYQLIHLAAHGSANVVHGHRSFVALTEDSVSRGKLQAGDIYNLELNAELVGLSACQSGIGEIQQGEGMISLARAFSFAGAKSVLSTLWSVDDRSTSQLMVGFYQALKNNNTKDESIQSAMVDYIRSATQVEAHPYYWAGFVLIGDARALTDVAGNNNWVYIGLGVLLVLFLIYLGHRGKINSRDI